MKKLCISLIFVLLSACATEGFLPPQHDQMLAAIKSCCTSMATLPFKSIQVGQSNRSFVGPNTETFEFEGEKSFFLAFKLPKESAKNIFTLRTFPQNMLNNRNGHVFVPKVMYLSSDFGVVSVVSPEFTVQKPIFIGESSWRVDLNLPSNASYAVIYTNAAQRSKTMRQRDSDQYGGYLYTRTGTAGEIEVELQ
jgi:maltose operon periplasmic protein